MRRLHAGVLLPPSRCCGEDPQPSEAAIADALGGVLCRCTGYRAILDAVNDAGDFGARRHAAPTRATRWAARLPRLDGARKLSGAEIFGADEWPADALIARAVRSPHAHARFALGDLEAYVSAPIPASSRSSPPRTCPAQTASASSRPFADQPVLRREPRALSRRGGRAGRRRQRDDARPRPRAFPVTWSRCRALTTLEEALADDARAASSGPRSEHPDDADAWRAAMPRRASPPRMSWSKARSRPASSSTPISSPRRASRAASATASRSRPARRRPIWTATTSRRSSASRRSRCASSRPRSAAASARSSICRFSPSSRSPPGCSTGRCAWSIRAANPCMTTTKRHPARIRARRSARRATGVSSRWISPPISTPAPTPPGGRRSPTACRSTRPVLIACRTTGPWRARSTRISCPPAPFAASACRRARSRKSNSSTNSRETRPSTRSSSASSTRWTPASRL